MSPEKTTGTRLAFDGKLPKLEVLDVEVDAKTLAAWLLWQRRESR